LLFEKRLEIRGLGLRDTKELDAPPNLAPRIAPLPSPLVSDVSRFAFPRARRHLDRAEPTPELESLRAYLAFAQEQARPSFRITDLLDDELEMILGKVAAKLRSPKQLMALSTLSRRFRKLVRQPAVWRELDVSQHRAFVTDSLLLRQIVRNDGAFAGLRRLNLGGCTRVTDAAIRRVLSICGKTLTHVYLEGCSLLTTELVRYASTACPHLEVLDLTACASVDTLEVLRLSDEEWPRLRELELMDTARLFGRVPQQKFVELHEMLSERRERFAEEARKKRAAAERAAEDERAFGRGSSDVLGGANPNAAGHSAEGHSADANAAVSPVAADPSSSEETEAEGGVLACRRGPALCLDELCEYVGECHKRLSAWNEGHQVAACDHAMVAQGAMSEHTYVLNMLPDCGHVICVECEQKSRVNMTRPHGADHYVYPCPVCAQDMPDPGGFTITLQ